MKSRMFPAFTLPPYWTRTAPATSPENIEPRAERIEETTSPASCGVAALPVPIAQIGS